jgi:hypothetical protein
VPTRDDDRFLSHSAPFNHCAFGKDQFLTRPFVCVRLIDILGSPIQLDRCQFTEVSMKRMLSVFAAVALFAVAGAANAAADAASQPSTCQGPPSQCNVFFGQ